jgi:hypothetical protein
MLTVIFFNSAHNRAGKFIYTVIVVYGNFYGRFMGIIKNSVGNLEYFIIKPVIGHTNKWKQYEQQYG